MIRFLRYLFGLHGVTGNRTVVGSPESMANKDLPYIQDSNQRLEALLELYTRYKNTAYAQKIYGVYEKTRRIHTYLVGRHRSQELELFHLQHTDHFLNTFTVIIEAHQQRPAPQFQTQTMPPAPPKAPGRPEVVGRTFVLGPFRSESKEVKAAQTQQRTAGSRVLVNPVQQKATITRLSLPEVAIDTYSRIVYLKEDVSDGLTPCEVGYTSTTEEKEAFMSYVAARLNIQDVTYIGNAMVSFPASADVPNPAEMVPVIHWNGCPYALSLEDNRLFPVSTFRQGRVNV